MLKLLLKKSPQHSSGLLQLARVLADAYQARDLVSLGTISEKEDMINESVEMYEQAIASMNEVIANDTNNISLYIFQDRSNFLFYPIIPIVWCCNS